MPVKIDSVFYENGKWLKKPKFSIKCYEPRSRGSIKQTFDTLGKAVQAVQHYYGTIAEFKCRRDCPFCVAIRKESNGKPKPAADGRGGKKVK